jgi:hypothetical protein
LICNIRSAARRARRSLARFILLLMRYVVLVFVESRSSK